MRFVELQMQHKKSSERTFCALLFSACRIRTQKQNIDPIRLNKSALTAFTCAFCGCAARESFPLEFFHCGNCCFVPNLSWLIDWLDIWWIAISAAVWPVFVRQLLKHFCYYPPLLSTRIDSLLSVLIAWALSSPFPPTSPNALTR